MRIYHFEKYIKAHRRDFLRAFKEIQGGSPKGEWMPWIFPRLEGLGFSETDDYYGISGVEEARAYMREPILREHLIAISEALLELPGNDISKFFPYPDDMRLRSSMTLFAKATPEYPVFRRVLDRFFRGEMDQRTLLSLKMR